MAELTISYSLYEICYDDIFDMEVYQKKSLNLLKKIQNMDLYHYS